MLAVITGSGFYRIDQKNVESRKEYYKKNKFGFPSDKVMLVAYEGIDFFHLPRHGLNHQWPPHKIPYRANFEALKALGVTCVISHCVCGSLKQNLAPRTFLVPDQFVDFTKRQDDFHPVNQFVHLPMSEPYSGKAQEIISKVITDAGHRVHPKGTIVVIDGPRFSTKAENQYFIRNDWDLVNMTQYPEAYMAREYGMTYGCFASITDYCSGVDGADCEITPDYFKEVKGHFEANTAASQEIILRLVKKSSEFGEIPSPKMVFREFFREN